MSGGFHASTRSVLSQFCSKLKRFPIRATLPTVPAQNATWTSIQRAVVWNKQECKHWATRSSVRSFACTAHSFTCSRLLASLVPSAALSHLLARSLRSPPRSLKSKFFMSQNDLILSYSAVTHLFDCPRYPTPLFSQQPRPIPSRSPLSYHVSLLSPRSPPPP